MELLISFVTALSFFTELCESYDSYDADSLRRQAGRPLLAFIIPYEQMIPNPPIAETLLGSRFDSDSPLLRRNAEAKLIDEALSDEETLINDSPSSEEENQFNKKHFENDDELENDEIVKESDDAGTNSMEVSRRDKEADEESINDALNQFYKEYFKDDTADDWTIGDNSEINDDEDSENFEDDESDNEGFTIDPISILKNTNLVPFRTPPKDSFKHYEELADEIAASIASRPEYAGPWSHSTEPIVVQATPGEEEETSALDEPEVVDVSKFANASPPDELKRELKLANQYLQARSLNDDVPDALSSEESTDEQEEIENIFETDDQVEVTTELAENQAEFTTELAGEQPEDTTDLPEEQEEVATEFVEDLAEIISNLELNWKETTDMNEGIAVEEATEQSIIDNEVSETESENKVPDIVAEITEELTTVPQEIEKHTTDEPPRIVTEKIVEPPRVVTEEIIQVLTTTESVATESSRDDSSGILPSCGELVCPSEAKFCRSNVKSLPPDFSQMLKVSECLSASKVVLKTREGLVDNPTPGRFYKKTEIVPVDHLQENLISLGDFFNPTY